jgi:hypothetical protein
MENTLLQNIISNFDLMDNQHFLDWFKENKKWMLEKEKEQIITAGNNCALRHHIHNDKLNKMTDEELFDFVKKEHKTFGEQYYDSTFMRSNKAEL